MKNNNVVLVTGGTGLVGRSLIPQLLANGVTVICLTRNPRKYKSTRQLKYVKCDLSSFADVRRVSSKLKQTKIKTAYYLAANIPPLSAKKETVFEAQRTTLAPFLSFLEAFGDDIEKIVFAGTIDIYGYPKKINFDESTKPNPATPYALAKFTCEEYLKHYCEIHDKSYVIVRFAQIFGSKEALVRVIPYIIDAARNNKPFTLYGNKQNKRKFLFAEDAAAALQQAAAYASNDTFHIAGREEIAVADVITVVEQIIGRPLKINHKNQDAPLSHILPSTKKAKTELKFTPKYTFREAMKIVLTSHL